MAGIDEAVEHVKSRMNEPHKMVGGASWTEVRVEDLRLILSSLRAMHEALGPFAAIANNDVGSDEADDDLYAPMSRANRRVPAVSVGMLRTAAQLHAQIGASRDQGL